ncbi:protein YgfX [Veronia pacifica]|uniref:protein YgfX n=1 Tax=Veronia pacifica TaxID=1080227 RepID=UPI001112EC95|nr:protein YgfX [Veronia pacifica]
MFRTTEANCVSFWLYPSRWAECLLWGVYLLLAAVAFLATALPLECRALILTILLSDRQTKSSALHALCGFYQLRLDGRLILSERPFSIQRVVVLSRLCIVLKISDTDKTTYIPLFSDAVSTDCYRHLSRIILGLRTRNI